MKNTDTWFIGYTSNLVLGVYAGYDEPKSLGKYSRLELKPQCPFLKIL